MIFSNQTFLFVFLPALLLVYWTAGRLFPGLRNSILLAFSLVFYSIGESAYLALIIGSVVLNHVLALCLAGLLERKGRRYHARCLLLLGVIGNLLPLLYFKYSNFILENIARLATIPVLPDRVEVSHLPLGISFFTFQAISYIVDVYRGSVSAERSIHRTALFICLFPQLIAGPIIRYKDIHTQFASRPHTWNMAAYGIIRFCIGLAKKVLLADAFGQFTDFAFGQNIDTVTFQLAWMGAIAFTLQVYFDFSAYSDMAIGLGALFGFRFPENFRYPYVAQSIREFWKRWHITLTTWFRDYLYASIRSLPGGRHFKNSNTFLVFILVGIWHGASWNFVLWGGYYGLFMILERQGLLRVIEELPRPLRHAYVLLVVVVSAVLFRGGSVAQIWTFLAAMFLSNPFAFPGDLFSIHADSELYVRLLIGMAAATPLLPAGIAWSKDRSGRPPDAIRLQPVLRVLVATGTFIVLSLLLVYTCGMVVSRSQSPFIYFRF